ncbi:2-succinyl-5-enolpyruvyl-6-hydroxy-3-cyclohexene-1-carboxylic-acid synthase [Actinocrispum sp. NPDC049592]|uniref:2-succinyl-5-enolpyruvyl-6-hydroxy-3- cyclohexene-1-carboxylic-acid synthase n=1 Tax=Actinocrispum sp. NPDC049592 TaxID=3154835 RepID=UPI003445471E
MNPSTAQAMVIIDELVRNDVRDVVVCPGSRNAPLSVALFEADRAGRLRMHVRVDERGAAFLAMGLTRATGRPAAVVCTSGTAVANMHPAVLEAYHSGIGLVVISADRPPELHGSGANQTIDQRNLFAPAAILVDFPVAERRAGLNPVWRGLVCRAIAQAESGRPVQINVPFREPLLPGFGGDWPESLDGRPDNERWTTSAPARSVAGSRVDFPLPARTLMVVGSGRTDRAAAACQVAMRAGWPIIAEPVAHTGGASVLRCGPLLLGLLDRAEDLRPEAVLVVGRPTLSRGVRGLMGKAPVYGIGDHPQWTDPQYVAIHVRGWLDTTDLAYVQGHDPEWLMAWRTAAERAATAVDKVLEEELWPSGMRVARDVVNALPPDSLLFLGSSNPVRDVDLVAETRTDIAIHANRGVAGIDGNVSTAIGLALGSGRPSYALIGDLTFLHDSNGLLTGLGQRQPDLTIVVLNDDGGGIFSLLEQGAAQYRDSFETVFGTPHGTDLRSLCDAHHVPYVLAESPDQLREALSPPNGLKVCEVRADRARLRDLHARMRAVVGDAVFG